ncbi:uncharacterized protein LOC130729486 [Lotus japonicus]|uniref:uncharacterized protein LOC130729486 n=1 Tax=Lotus japonicus TaxID=34305 RepID=UPI0025850029|nr:uncharacterized protein LOC130729486 [Lotus japonicus]
MWKASAFSLIRTFKRDRYVFIVARDVVLIGNIYGPSIEGEREIFFVELGTFLSNWQEGYVLGGDFNATLNAEDRSGGLGGLELSFGSFVNECRLIDLPLQNSEFTWFSPRNGGVRSRIDRWLLNEVAWSSLEEAIQRVENWGLSDHRAVSLVIGHFSSGPKPFMLYNNWLLDKDFERMVQEWWSTNTVQGWTGYVLQKKLKDLKVKIKEWKCHSHAHEEEKIKELEGELQSVMERLEEEGVTEELRLKRT